MCTPYSRYRCAPTFCAAVGAFLAMLSVAPLLAQQQPAPGTRVRVITADGVKTTGTLVELRGDSVLLQADGGKRFAAALRRVTRLEVSQGRPSLNGKGALIGAGVGGAAGVGIGLLLDDAWAPLVVGAVGATSGAMLGAGGSSARKGAGIGLLIGALTGAVLGVAAAEEGTDLRTTDAAFIGAALFGGVGLYTGGIIGTFNRGERWQSVPVEGIRVSIVPQRCGRVGLGIVAFF